MSAVFFAYQLHLNKTIKIDLSTEGKKMSCIGKGVTLQSKQTCLTKEVNSGSRGEGFLLLYNKVILCHSRV